MLRRVPKILSRHRLLRFAQLNLENENLSTTMASRGRPERQGPPQMFYNVDEARKYTFNSRITEVQCQLAERAFELLALPEGVPALLLDVGCGSGLSGEVLSENGHTWIGVDISESMLDVAIEREIDGDLILTDMGQGLPFRAGTFDGVISISALQWLCNVDSKSHHAPRRLFAFFTTLYAAMSRGATAVFQVYPASDFQLELMTAQARRAGFTGGTVIDYPNSTKAKKIFIVLFTGGFNPTMPAGLTGRDVMPKTEESPQDGSRSKAIARGSKKWIQKKKQQAKRQGKDTARDSKYTGRKRSRHF